MTRDCRPRLSVVVPFLDEAPSLPALVEEIGATLGDDPDWEAVLVDDGSRDDWREGLEALPDDLKDRITLVVFRRNLGKASALAAGFRKARGDVIVTLDADLQDDPSQIPALVSKLDEGWDMVVGRKVPRRDPPTKVLASLVWNFLVRLLSGVRLHDMNSGFKVMRREVVEFTGLYGEMHRLLPLLASWRGFRVTEADVSHRPRKYGRSRYGPARAWRGLFDLVTVTFLMRYHKRPMHLIGGVAGILFFFGAAINVYLLVFWLMGGSLQQRPLLFFGILLILLSGQVLSVGLLGEMITFFTHRDDLSAYVRSTGPLCGEEGGGDGDDGSDPGDEAPP